VQANACSPEKGLAGNELRYSTIPHEHDIAKWGHYPIGGPPRAVAIEDRVNKMDFKFLTFKGWGRVPEFISLGLKLAF
jgi:hypothetical protein